MWLIVDLVTAFFAIGAFMGLRADNNELISSIENTSQRKLLSRTILTISGLLFLLIFTFRRFGISIQCALLFGIIIYEVICSVAMLFFKDVYINILNAIGEVSSPLVLKAPLLAEAALFGYLFWAL